MNRLYEDGGDWVVFDEHMQAANEDFVRHVGTNRYAKKCAHCQKMVGEEKGELFIDELRDEWIVVHRDDCPKFSTSQALKDLTFTGVTLTLIFILFMVLL